jgi:uncharacterized protein (DUF302 family)
MNKTNFSYWKKVEIPFEQAIEKVTEELQKEGFGILTQIDVTATLKNKLDIDFKPYRILGACNPPIAHKVLQQEEQIGLMLPCNFVVYVNDASETIVACINPNASIKAVGNDALVSFADLVDSKLQNVINAV